jgi:pimeloyl-ACP methyl ester carboxylesterase
VLKVGGHSIEFNETGAGPAVLFVPGSYSTSAAWRGIQKYLPQSFRFAATSLCGYGDTQETRTENDFDIGHQVRVVQAAAKHIGKPVHLVGHSFGGTIALATALAGTTEVLSVTTFEANPLLVLQETGYAQEFAATRKMSAGFEAAYEADEADAAGRIIDFWGGEGSFAAMPEGVRDHCRELAYANVLDWRSAYCFTATRADYATLDMPVLLVRGALANPAMEAITASLAAAIPNARATEVAHASHFLITTHPKQCAQLLAGFLDKVGR